jgi:hypothetical protein
MAMTEARVLMRVLDEAEISTRYDKTARNYRSFILMARTILWLSLIL